MISDDDAQGMGVKGNGQQRLSGSPDDHCHFGVARVHDEADLHWAESAGKEKSTIMTRSAVGELDIGPSGGHLRLRTYRQGLAAKVGHDLVLEAAEWHGRLHLPSAAGGSPSAEAQPGGSPLAEAEVHGEIEVAVEVDLRRLEVREGTGGVKPLTDKDKADIVKAMRQPLRIGAQPVATFRSSSVRVEGDRATVAGELFIAGQSHPVELDVRREADGTISGTTQILQSAWGIKPYSGFFGALKLRDAVDVEFAFRLPD
jgi:hypothetical protein